MTSAGGPETTFRGAYEEMRATLVAHGAGERAVVGTVGKSVMIYGLTEDPPRIVQIQALTYEVARAGLPGKTATVTLLGVGENDIPKVRVGRLTEPLSSDPQVVFEAALDQRQTKSLPTQGYGADVVFGTVRDNLRQFVPQMSPPVE